MNWYEKKHWDDEAHRTFYEKYKTASPKEQATALIIQARILSHSENNEVLKAAESLLLLWVSSHYEKEKIAEVYELIKDLCHKMGDQERARIFESQLRALKP